MSIKNWNEDDKPREKLMKLGAESLSDSELLAILIGHGTKGFSAIDVAKDMLLTFESLSNLVNIQPKRLQKIKGIGFTKSIIFAAAFEIAKRVKYDNSSFYSQFKTPEDVAKYYIPRMSGLKKEQFRIVMLNTSNKIYKEVTVSEGTLSSSLVHPREVFKEAIIESAASIMLVHNHPSGNPEPSREDILITDKLVAAGEIIGIKVLDHIIIAGDNYVSFVKLGLI